MDLFYKTREKNTREKIKIIVMTTNELTASETQSEPTIGQIEYDRIMALTRSTLSEETLYGHLG